MHINRHKVTLSTDTLSLRLREVFCKNILGLFHWKMCRRGEVNVKCFYFKGGRCGLKFCSLPPVPHIFKWNCPYLEKAKWHLNSWLLVVWWSNQHLFLFIFRIAPVTNGRKTVKLITNHICKTLLLPQQIFCYENVLGILHNQGYSIQSMGEERKFWDSPLLDFEFLEDPPPLELNLCLPPELN